jgi:UDP:flavonoid glycosyltransferase YjiC (YdhE family)
MEPFLSLGEILLEKGHQVICAFPEQFRDLAKDSNMEFASLGLKFIDMLDSDVGKTALGGGGSGLKKFLAFIRLAINQTAINKELINKQYDLIESENPDRIVYNGKAVYAISPTVFSRPDYWKDNITVLGYHERQKNINWQPDNKLSEFLEKHKKILFITFGSMTNPDPDKKTEIIIEILERNNIPAIINTASGGLVRPEMYDSEMIHFVSRIPYDWIFPKIYGVIHHGGSGTTHLALKYGCATMIIPHIIDQFVWNKIVYDIGAGPKGVNIGKISLKNLEPKILELLKNSSFKIKAEQIASEMKKENFREEIYNSIIEE